MPWLLLILAAGRFDVRAYGATGDGATLDTAPIQHAVNDCVAAGGGLVVVPPGTYLSGSLTLGNGVTLHLQPGATLLGSRSMDDYRGGSLLRGDDLDNVGITGGGTIDGQGATFWERAEPYVGPPWLSSAQHEYRALRRPSFVRFTRCRNVVVRDVTLTGAPSWTLHLNRCVGATVEKVTIRNPLYGPNTDGIDINMCQQVTVRDCDIITGDDGIVLKSTDPGHDHPSRDILVEDCRIWSACNCLKIGTETHDSFERITFRRCHLYSDTDRALDRAHSGVSIESVDGAHLSDILVEQITIEGVRAALFVRLGHRGGNSEATRQVEPRVPGRIDGVTFRDITAKRVMMESSIVGLPGHPVENVRLERVSLGHEGGGLPDWVLGDVPEDEVRARYPEANMFGRLPAYGLYCRHVAGLAIDGLELLANAPDPRPALVCDNVAGLAVTGLAASPSAGRFPVVWLQRVTGASLTKSTAPDGTTVFVLAEASPGAAVVGNRLPAGAAELVLGATGGLVRVEVPLIAEEAPGRVVIEAEAMGLAAPMVVVEDAGARGGRAIQVPPGGGRDTGLARVRFTVTEPGEYRAWARVLATDGESDSFHLRLDDTPPVISDVLRRGEWLWDVVRARVDGGVAWDNAATWRLEAGEHLVTLRNREAGTRLDCLVIATAKPDIVGL